MAVTEQRSCMEWEDGVGHPFGSEETQACTPRNDQTLLHRNPSSNCLSFPWQRHAELDNHTLRSRLQDYVIKLNKRGVASFRDNTWTALLCSILPCARWLKTYPIKKFLLADFLAGISVGFMLVPQSMSYAKLAGLPVVYGLYGGFLPVLVYSFFGSSPHLAVGPVAVTSLLLANGLAKIVPGYTAASIHNPDKLTAAQRPLQEVYNHKAIQVAFLVAILYTSVGVLRLGFLTRFLSHSVIGGFTSGASILIGLSQVKYILGVNVPQSSTLQESLRGYIHHIHEFKWQEFVMGSILLMWLVLLKYLGKNVARLRWLRALGPISACAIGLISVYLGHVDKRGIRTVNHIPAGLPTPTIGWWLPLDDIGQLLPLAAIVCVVDLTESVSIARALARKYGYTLPYNQEIVGLGLANFMGAAFHSYTTTGSFSRSAVNSDTGARTPLAGFFTAWVVGFTLLFLTPVFEKLPMNVLGAIVINSVTGLLDVQMAVYLFRVKKQDWLVWMTCFFVTLFAGVELGLGTSIGVALLIVIYETAFPHTARLGRIPNSTVYRNVKQYPEAETPPGMLVFRIDAPIYFANVAHITERLHKYILRAELDAAATGWKVEFIILDLSPVTDIDATGLCWLEEMLAAEKHKRQLVLCNPSPGMVAQLQRAGVLEKLGRSWVFVRVHDAVVACHSILLHKALVQEPAAAPEPEHVVAQPSEVALASYDPTF